MYTILGNIIEFIRFNEARDQLWIKYLHFIGSMRWIILINSICLLLFLRNVYLSVSMSFNGVGDALEKATNPTMAQRKIAEIFMFLGQMMSDE